MLNKNSAIILANGVPMPMLGLGVFQIPEAGGVLRRCILNALDAGYRAFDTAKYYQNEAGLGRALRESGLKREEYFVTTKLWVEDVKSCRTKEAFYEALERFGFDYLDLFIIHWPVKGFEAAWIEMEELYRQGMVRAIGVSNCWADHLEKIQAVQTIRPMVNQIEYHPWKQQREVCTYCREKGIPVQAYGPLMQGALLHEPVIAGIAGKHQKTTAQVILRWNLQKGVSTIPKSANKDRIYENIDLFDFSLSEEEMAEIDALERNVGSLPDPYSVV